MVAFNEGAPCWVEAALPDQQAGRRFYGELFGWTYRSGERADGGTGPYDRAELDGRAVGAVTGGERAQWSLCFATSDVAALAARIGDAGGKVLLEPTPIGSDGTLLVAADPGGTAFGAWQAAGHAGFEIQGEHGSFFWPEVYTRAKGDVDPFYEKALGYSAQQVSDDAAFDFAVYTLPGNPAPVVGRLQMGEHFPAEMPAHMLVYFRVDDCDAAVAAVRRLGGSVEREPTDTPFGRSALVADDQGARFALMGPTAS